MKCQCTLSVMNIVTVVIVLLPLALAFGACTTASPQVSPPAPGNTTRLINNWTITPAGTETRLGDLPMNAVLSPDGRDLLVSNDGAGVQSLQIISTSTGQMLQTIPYMVPTSVFIGLAYSPDGTHAYASGGGSEVVHTYNVSTNGHLAASGDITIGTLKANPFPTGLSISPDGQTLYVANDLANTVSIIDVAAKRVTDTIAVGDHPYTALPGKDGKTVYVSNWGDGTISVLDTRTKKVTTTITVGQHPNVMVFGPAGLLYVADANSDAVSVIDTGSNKVVRTISVNLYPHAPFGSSPEGLSVSHDGQHLYVADSGNNDIVVIGLHGSQGPERVEGKIPTAWYPSSVVVSNDDRTVFVTNAKGRGAGPNNKGVNPNPMRKNTPVVPGTLRYNDQYCNCTYDQFSGTMIVGTLSTIAIPAQGLLDLYSDQVARNDHVGDNSPLMRDAGNPIPIPGQSSPIKHVIYIIKENRSYDQVFGDLPQGNNDPALTLFGKENTPNLHALAERYGIFDNFYADAEVSAAGHNWTDSANDSDYNEKIWPQSFPYDLPGVDRNHPADQGSKIDLSAGGYLWDDAVQAGISYRDYGEYSSPPFSASQEKLIPASQASACPGAIAHSYSSVSIPSGDVLCFPPEKINAAASPHLVGHYDPHFRTFDLQYHEADRVNEWQREFQQFVANNDLPQLTILYLPSDHTFGTWAGFLTPQAAVAENDLAVGQVVESVSQSKYWPSSAIFVTEDDAQNGPDHVDSHRTESLVISPYTNHASSFVDHTPYDTAAMVRTIELILGLNPMSQYDLAAMPMWRDFTKTANTAPYTALAEKYPPTLVNAADAYGAKESAKMDFNYPDANPEGALNEIIWHDIKGATTPYPGTKGSTIATASDTDG